MKNKKYRYLIGDTDNRTCADIKAPSTRLVIVVVYAIYMTVQFDSDTTNVAVIDIQHYLYTKAGQQIW